jgi:hypothetical protein
MEKREQERERERGTGTSRPHDLKRAREDSRSRGATDFSIQEERNRKLARFALVPKLVIRVGRYPGDLC